MIECGLARIQLINLVKLIVFYFKVFAVSCSKTADSRAGTAPTLFSPCFCKSLSRSLSLSCRWYAAVAVLE
uniref:Putative secreted protein n=1 Tax=Anopheles marajoara TaxID=58244 RepID=A0A2M4CEK0_9DIPT